MTASEINVQKLDAPRNLPDAIARDALFARGLDDPSVQLVLLQAPAGHGKTTTLLQFKERAERDGARTAWLTFDNADNDTRRFSVHLQAVIDRVAPVDVREADTGQHDALIPRRASDWLIDRLMQSREPIALFFDEFQQLQQPDLLGFCQEWFERLPMHVRVYIGTRAEPAIHLSRMIVSRRAVVLRTEDLRFTRDEVSRYFDAQLGTEVTRDEVDSIFRLTEGWPVAVQLYGLSLSSADVRRTLHLPPPQTQELARYLSSRVLMLQEPGIRDFLLKTSILKRLCGPLCQAVTGRSDAVHILLDLERSGLFLRRLGIDGVWFRYHGLFSDFLIAEFGRTSAAAKADAHRCAAAWNLKHGYYEDAVYHWLECGDVGAAADALAVFGKELVANGSLITLEYWSDRLPFDEIAKRADLSIAVAYAYVFLRRFDKLPPLLALFDTLIGSGSVEATTSPDIVLSMAAVAADDTARAFALIDRVPVDALQPGGFSAFELGAASNLLAYREITLGRFAEVDHHIHVARRCNVMGKAAFSHGYTVGVAGASALLQGSLDEAITIFQRGLATHYAELGESFSLAALVSCYVWGLYESGQYASALALFDQHRSIISGSALPDFFAVAFLSAARMRSSSGDRSQADALLDVAADIAERNRWSRLQALIGWERVRTAIADDDLAQAQALADTIAPTLLPSGWVPFSEELECEVLGRLRLLAHAGPVTAAREALDAEKLRSHNRPFRTMKLQLLDAVLLDRRGDRRGAQRLLQGVIRAAELGGFISVFANEGRTIAKLLQDMYSAMLLHPQTGDLPVSTEFISAVLACCRIGITGNAPPVAAEPQHEPLSEREIDVLALLGSGVKNKGMAQHLFVSENTIKFHLKNIFAKLHVTSRSEAIITARRLGIIE